MARPYSGGLPAGRSMRARGMRGFPLLSLEESFTDKGHRDTCHVSVDSFSASALIARAGPSTRKKFFEFFTVPIRNANIRAAYYRAIQQFLSWCERAGYQHLEDIEPITVAAYIETLQRQAAPPTVKQHMAAIRMLFSWLTEKGVLAMNPAREVKTERFSRTEGKTPAFVEGEVQKLPGAIETSSTRASAIALCSGSLPTLSPGSAPS